MVQTIGPGGLPSAKSQREVKTIKGVAGKSTLHIPLSGLGGRVTEPLGYVMLQVQIPYVPSYDEDQVALVVLEDTNFLRKCQVVLGTPMINRAIRAMKESEMEDAPEANTHTSSPTTWSIWIQRITA